MALFISTDTHRIDLPADLPHVAEGDWIEITTSWTAAMRRRVTRRGLAPDPIKPGEASFDYNSWKQALLEEIILSWSEKEPVSPDSIGQLHPRVQDYIAEQFDKFAEGRTEAEVNASSSSSPLGLEPVEADSPASSATSPN